MENTINDFKRGDRVYHISQLQYETKTEMIVYSVSSQVECRWITYKGKPQYASFYPFELHKI